MKKIEKLSNLDLRKDPLDITSSEWGIMSKLNELIEAFNQSQKRPGGIEVKEYLQKMLDRWNTYDELDGFVAENFRTDLEKLLEYWDLRIKEEPVRVFYTGDVYTTSNKEPEKQEEWRKRITWEDGEYFMIDGKEANEEDLRDFISQLLSERTFTKEELFMLKLVTNDIHNKGNYAYDEIADKISKLLKE